MTATEVLETYVCKPREEHVAGRSTRALSALGYSPSQVP